MAARSFLGAGNVQADVFVNGSPSGKTVPFSQIGKFAITPRSELKEQTSKDRVDYGQVIEAVALAQPPEFSMTVREINRDSLQLLLMADQEAINTSSANVSNENFVVSSKGVYLPLAHENIAAAGFVVTNAAGSTTYVYGTDYLVNWAFGRMIILPGSAIAEAAQLKVDYVANAVAGALLRGGKRSSIRARLYFDGINLVDNLPAKARIWEVLLTPSGEFDFMADDWAEGTLEGRMKTPTGFTEPYQIELHDTVTSG